MNLMSITTEYTDDDDRKVRVAVQGRQVAASGTTFDSFVKDCTALLPKEKLNDLFQQKLAEVSITLKTRLPGLDLDWASLFKLVFNLIMTALSSKFGGPNRQPEIFYFPLIHRTILVYRLAKVSVA